MVGLVADTLGDLAEDENSVFHMEADHEFLKWLQQHKHREESNDRARRTLDGTYNDEDYAVLRAISSETGVSGRKFGILFAGFFFFFTHKLPQKKQLISRKKLAAHCRRLEVFDAAQIRKEVLALDESASSYNLGYMSDATDNKGERIVTYFTYPVADMSGPKAVFTGIGHVFDKTFGRCTAEALTRIRAFLGDEGVGHVAGSCMDHAALTEVRAFFDLCDSEGIQMNHDRDSLLLMGDDFHKLSLICRLAASVAFGEERGKDSHCYYNLLYLRNYVMRKYGRAARRLQADTMGKELPMPTKPNPQRWTTIGEASLQFMGERDLPSTFEHDEGDKFAVPDSWDDMAKKSKNLMEDLCQQISKMQHDPRIVVATCFEAEMYTQFHKPAMDWNKRPSSLGYDYMFKGGDFPAQVESRIKWWEEAAENPPEYFENTFQLVDELFLEGPHDTIGGKPKAEAYDAMVLRVVQGIHAARDKIVEMYSCWCKVPCLFYHLRGPHKQVVAHFMLEAIDGELGPTQGMAARGGVLAGLCEIPASELLWFKRNVLPGKGFENNRKGLLREMKAFIDDFKLSEWPGAVEDLRSLVLEMDPGVHLQELGLDSLHAYLYFNVGCVPVVNLIVELTFSQLKHTLQNNDGALSVDRKMFTVMNTLRPMRTKLRQMKTLEGTPYKRPKHDETLRHHLQWVADIAKQSYEYIVGKLAGIPKVTALLSFFFP